MMILIGILRMKMIGIFQILIGFYQIGKNLIGIYIGKNLI